jgi:hypothetical protein
MIVRSKPEAKLKLADEDFDVRTTKAFRRPFGPARERVRPNPLFRRVAELLQLDHDEACKHLAPAMIQAEATPHSFTRAHLVAVSPAILEVIETVMPAEARQEARDQLCALLQEGPA